jgi:hypothetical protein
MRTMQKVWIKKGVIYVPHLNKPKTWVGPGYGFQNDKEYSEQKMRALGAIDSMRLLYPKTEVN